MKFNIAQFIFALLITSVVYDVIGIEVAERASPKMAYLIGFGVGYLFVVILWALHDHRRDTR